MRAIDRLRWRLLAQTLMVVAAACLLAWAALPQYAEAIEFFFLAVPSSSFLLIPHEPIVLAYASRVEPWLLGVLSGLGAGIAAAVDYQVFHQVLQWQRLEPVKRSRFYDWSVRWFRAAPSFTTWVFFLLPLPDYPIRILAPAARFSRVRYVAAVALGRGPRAFALAWWGASLRLVWWEIALVAVAIVALSVWPLLGRGRRRGSRDASAAGTTDASVQEDGEREERKEEDERQHDLHG